MAITNAQQYKQLVNPPLDGKRPGYQWTMLQYQDGNRSSSTSSSSKSGPSGPSRRNPGEGRASRDSGVISKEDTGGYATIMLLQE